MLQRQESKKTKNIYMTVKSDCFSNTYKTFIEEVGVNRSVLIRTWETSSHWFCLGSGSRQSAGPALILVLQPENLLEFCLQSLGMRQRHYQHVKFKASLNKVYKDCTLDYNKFILTSSSSSPPLSRWSCAPLNLSITIPLWLPLSCPLFWLTIFNE